jgi:hypothetical protein
LGELIMNRFVRATSTAAACALAFVPMLALATAHAAVVPAPIAHPAAQVVVLATPAKAS